MIFEEIRWKVARSQAVQTTASSLYRPWDNRLRHPIFIDMSMANFTERVWHSDQSELPHYKMKKILTRQRQQNVSVTRTY